ncbi:MAG: hypothetical protein M1839_005962 [Geoglossum umbratile]|nr:MAG: hypothetical protein M1839_005962 [Geoglossum umbratile]
MPIGTLDDLKGKKRAKKQGRSTPKKQKTGVHTLAEVKANTRDEEDIESQKNASEDDSDDTYNPSLHSSEDISDGDNSSYESDNDDRDMLGIPNMEEEDKEIGSDMEEVVATDGKVTRRKGGEASKLVELKIKADEKFTKLNKLHQRRFKAFLNRTYRDAIPDKDIDESEVKDIVNFKRAEKGARWTLIPDENGDMVKLGDGIYREIGTSRYYKRNSRTNPQDKSFAVKEVAK